MRIKILKAIRMKVDLHRSGAFGTLNHRFHVAELLVRIFYAAQFVFLSDQVRRWDELRAAANMDPLWPVWWVPKLGISNSISLILLIYGFGLLVSVINSRIRLGRILSFVGLILTAAFINSFGKIGHSYHAWIYVSFLFLFLPTKVESRFHRLVFLNVFLTAQAMIMMIYTLAGYWKIHYALQQFLMGEMSAFSIKGFSNMLAATFLRKNEGSSVGVFILHHPFSGWALFWGAIYVEFFSLVAILRPSLHRLWGVLLIGLHIGTQLTVGASFRSNIFLLAILICGSPFASRSMSVAEVFWELPVVRFAARLAGIFTNVRKHGPRS